MFQFLRSACLVLTVACAISACGDRRTDEQKFQDALTNIEAGNHRAASVDLKNLLRTDPDNAAARIALGKALMGLADVPAAEKELSRAHELGANPNEYMATWARALMMNGAFAELLSELQPNAVSDPGQRAIVNAYRGSATLALSDARDDAREQAVRTFDAIIEENASNEAVRIALLGKAEVERLRGNLSGAETLIRRSLDAVPDSVESTLALANLMMAQQNWDEAVEVYKFGREQLQPDAMQAFLLQTGQINALLSAGKIEEGAAAAESLAETGNRHPLVGYLRGRAALQSGDPDRAVEVLQDALARSNNDPRIEALLGAAHLNLRNFEQAEMHLSSSLSKQPGNTMVTRMLAETRLAMQRPDDAQDTIRGGMPADGSIEDPTLLALLGRSSISQGEQEQGIAYLEESHAADPDNVAIMLALASGYVSAGRFDDATEMLNKVPEGAIEPQRREVLLAIASFDRANPQNSYGEIARLADKWNDDPQVLTVVGNFYASAGDLERAEQAYRDVLELDPLDRGAILNIARIDDQNGEYAESKVNLDRYLAENPRDVTALLARSRIADREGQREESAQFVRAAYDADSTALIPNLILAGRAIAGNDAEAAVRHARAAVNNHPDALQAHTTMAVVEYRNGNGQKALASLNRAVELRPDYVPLHLYKGRVERELNLPAQSRQSFQRALDLEPNNIVALGELINAEARAGNHDRAEELANVLVAERPGEAAALEIKGDVFAARGDHSRAIELYRQASAIDSTARLAAKLFRSRTINGSSDAYSSLLDYLDKNPDDVTTRLVLAQEFQRGGRETEAIEQYEMILDVAPESPLALNNLAWAYHERGGAEDILRAIELSEKAHELAPQSPDIADTYGWILVESGQVTDGTNMLRRALGLTSARDKPEIAYHLAAALEMAGNASEARQVLSEALASSAPFVSRSEAQSLYDSL